MERTVVVLLLGVFCICIGCSESMSEKVMPSGYQHLVLGETQGATLMGMTAVKGWSGAYWGGIDPDQSFRHTPKDDSRFRVVSPAFKAGRLMGVNFVIPFEKCSDAMFAGMTRAINKKLGCTAKLSERGRYSFGKYAYWERCTEKDGINMTLSKDNSQLPCVMMLTIWSTKADQWIKEGVEVKM